MMLPTLEEAASIYLNSKITIEKLYDVKNDKEIETINPGIKGQQVKIKIPYELVPGTIIRRKR